MVPTTGSWLASLLGGSTTSPAPTPQPKPASAPAALSVAPVTSSGVPAQAVELVAGFEGLRLKVYPDPGTGGVPWTIGYGSTRDEAGNPFGPASPPITLDRAKALLQRDLKGSADSLSSLCPRALPEPCRAALISLIYNIGATNFKASTLLKLLNAGNLLAAADEFPKWNRGGGKVLNGLVVRRAAERKVFLAGLN